MRTYLFLIGLFFTPLLASAAGDTSVACTMEYAPVCGSVEVQCITTPCNSVRETFSNTCMANAKKAANITQGACDSTPAIGGNTDAHGCLTSAGYSWNTSKNACTRSWEDTPIVGGDSDAHGCKASAGYSWNSAAGQCLRPWESRVKVITVGPKTVTCTGVAPMQCMQIRSGLARWQNLYGNIVGFDYVPGYTYRLRVLETKVENPPADAPNRTYTLIRMLSKKPTDETLLSSPLHGTWKLTSYNGKDVTGNYTANFESDRVSLKFCNTMNGSYTLSGNTFSSRGFMSTMMYCEGEAMTLENNFDLEGATYTMMAVMRTQGSTGPTIYISITTKKGNIYTLGR